MLRLIESSGVAGRAQIAAILLIGAIALLSTGMGENPFRPLMESFANPAVLKWTFLAVSPVTAMGFRKSLSRTAIRLSQERSPVNLLG